MAYDGYETIETTNAVKNANDLTIPDNTTYVELQADGQDVRYTMDTTYNPTQTTGMILQNGLAPEKFTVRDLRRIRFVRGAATNGRLSLHYYN